MMITDESFSGMQKFYRAIASLGLCLFISASPELVAADEAADAPDFPLKVEVRTIRAEGALPADAPLPTPGDVEKSIHDLATQLSHLRYSNFRLVDEQVLTLPPRKRRKLALADGHQITLRPVAVSGDTICLWLKWKDRSGAQILDTRVRFVAGQSMLTGTEHTPDVGLILAIKVEPIIQ